MVGQCIQCGRVAWFSWGSFRFCAECLQKIKRKKASRQ